MTNGMTALDVVVTAVIGTVLVEVSVETAVEMAIGNPGAVEIAT